MEKNKNEQKHCFASCTKLRSGKRKFGVWAVHWGGDPSVMVQVDLIEEGTGVIYSRSYGELERLLANGTMEF